MHANKSFNRNPANHRLYHALMESLIEDENAMDKGVADTVQDHKRKHDDDDKDPPARPTKETPKGKAPSKGSETGKSASAKEQVEEPIAEVVIDDAGEDVVHNDDQPQDTSEPRTVKTPNPECLGSNLKWSLLQKACYHVYILSECLPTDYFFNNDLEYLKSSDPERMYTTSVTKTKAAWYEIEGIEDMSVSVKKLHGYGHLEEIVVKRADRQLYKFKEVMRADELYKFSDGTLKKVQGELHHRVLDFDFGYNKEMPRRKWTATERKWTYRLIVRLRKDFGCENNICMLTVVVKMMDPDRWLRVDFDMEDGCEGLRGFDSSEEEVVPNVEDVSLVNGVFDDAFGGDGEEEVVMSKGVVVTSSSLEMLTKSCLGGIMVRGPDLCDQYEYTKMYLGRKEGRFGMDHPRNTIWPQSSSDHCR
ncbi:hypothetical protein Tco_0773697 [Tanacetum coccineum]|uniref:Uncharacterized protein n=1 Tax=Tanacetum coccineum TaxID=301880 RepID=A0ABQ4ZNP7_9ASTR